MHLSASASHHKKYYSKLCHASVIQLIRQLDDKYLQQWGQVIFDSQNTFQGKSLYSEVMQEHAPSYTPGDIIKAKVMREVKESVFGLIGCCLRQVKPRTRIDPEVKSFLAQGPYIYMTSTLGRGEGSPKSRQKKQNQLISVHDEGGGGSKIRKFCRHHIIMASQLFIRGEEHSSAKVKSLPKLCVPGWVTPPPCTGGEFTQLGVILFTPFVLPS